MCQSTGLSTFGGYGHLGSRRTLVCFEVTLEGRQIKRITLLLNEQETEKDRNQGFEG